MIGCEDRLRNDLYCVGWGVKLYSNQILKPNVPFQPPNLPTPLVASAVVYHMQACLSLSRVRILKPHLTSLVFLFLTTLPMFSGPLPILTSYQFLTLVSFLFLALSLQVPQLFGTPFWTLVIAEDISVFNW